MACPAIVVLTDAKALPGRCIYHLRK